MATNYFWDEIEDNVVEEYDGDTGNTIVSYTTEPKIYGSVLSQDGGGEIRHFQFDGQGNTTELTDNISRVTDSRRYTAFGNTTETTGTIDLSYAFGGQYGLHSDALSGVYVRRRSYLAPEGRWLSHDQDDRIAITQGYFIFATNSPISVFDPSGLVATTLTQEVVGKPQNGPCGKYSLETRWKVAPKEAAGFIIQKVTFTNNANKPTPLCRRPYPPPGPCPSPALCINQLPGDTYTELWVVNPSSEEWDKQITVQNAAIVPRVVFDIARDPNNHPPLTDFFAAFGFGSYIADKHFIGSRGNVTQEGEATFVPIKSLKNSLKTNNQLVNDINSLGVGNRGVARACALRSGLANIYDKLNGTKGLTKKSVQKKWDCCCCDPQSVGDFGKRMTDLVIVVDGEQIDVSGNITAGKANPVNPPVCQDC